MQQGREVNELGDDRELASGLAHRMAKAGRRQEQRERADALAAGLEQVARRFGRRARPLAHRGGEQLVDARHVLAEERVNVREPAGRHVPRPRGGGRVTELFDGDGGFQGRLPARSGGAAQLFKMI